MPANKVEAWVVLLLQVILVVLFGLFAVYDDHYEAESYPMFQDVHVMIFVGFGFLMTFLRRYGFSAVGFNFLLGALIVQWAMLCQGFYQLNENNKISLGIESLYKADIAAAAVLISMGAVLGRTSYMQLLIMGFLEIAVFSANSYLGSEIFQVADAGGSIFVHAFGAYFGLAASYVINAKMQKAEGEDLEGSSYTSDLFAMIGTIFLWLFWPSFNAVEATVSGQQRAIINTYISLAACCVTTFAISLLSSKERKFDMVHIQNSTLAGGVAVGTSANLAVEPYGAALIGVAAGAISVFGYAKLTPWLQTHFGIRDTCGVHNLHGIPGVLAGLIGAFMAGIASESIYDKTLYEIYPARAPPNMTATVEYPFLKAGEGRTAREQAGYQVLGLVVTLALAIVSGAITGLLLRNLKIDLDGGDYFKDDNFWEVPESTLVSKIPPKKSSVVDYQYDNPTFEAPFPKTTSDVTVFS